ncbi:hypothetical protein [Paracoccus versutus]|nr:hypothetical protein [Paracoccus versutus]
MMNPQITYRSSEIADRGDLGAMMMEAGCRSKREIWLGAEYFDGL